MFLVCTWCHHFLKSNTKEPPKLLPPSGTRGDKFVSVNDFSAQYLASSNNRHILNFRVMAVRDMKLWTCSVNLCKVFPQIYIWSLGRRTDLKLGEVSYIFISYNMTISWLYTLNGFRIIFNCVIVQPQYNPRVGEAKVDPAYMIVDNRYWCVKYDISKCPYSLSFLSVGRSSAFCRVHFHFFDTNFCFFILNLGITWRSRLLVKRVTA